MPRPRGQLVYFQPPGSKGRACIGEVAQFDEVEDDECDEHTHVPIRYRGRVMAAPLESIRLVGGHG